jgi:hypothetical protein
MPSEEGKPMDGAARRVTFVVRIVQEDAGRMRAVVERVQTGRKAHASTTEDIGRVIAAMLTQEAQT